MEVQAMLRALRHNRTVVVAAACAWLVATATARADALVWEPVGGMYGGGVQEAAAIPGGALLARAAGGVWRSPDRGDTWTPTGGTTGGWAVLGTTVFGLSADGVIASDDGGKTWRPTGLDAPVRVLATSDDAVYALTETTVLRFDGAAWHAVADVSSLEDPSLLAVAGEHMFVSRQAVWAEEAVDTLWRMSPGVDSWKPLLQSQHLVDGVEALTSFDGRILVGRPASNLLWSDDLGETWENTGGPSFARKFAADAGFLYTTGEWWFARSDDGGATWPGYAAIWRWEPFASSRPSGFGGALAAADGFAYAATYSSGLYRARHGDADWDLIGVAELPAPGLMAAGGGHVVATSGREVFLLSDADSTWRRSAHSPTYYGGLISDADSLYVGAIGGVQRTVDGGRTWTGADFGGASVLAMAAFDGALYAAAAELAWPAAPSKAAQGGFQILRSVDEAGTWVDISAGLPDFVSGLYQLAGARGTLLTEVGGYVSPNLIREWHRWRGGVWSPAPTPPGESVLGVGASFYSAVEDGIMRSRDGGDTWAPFAVGVPDIRVQSIVPLNGALYVGSSDGIYMSPDDGLQWRAIDGGLRGSTVLSMAASDRYMYTAIEGGGVVRAPLPDVGADVDARGRRLSAWADLKSDVGIPRETALFPNYPSPFNPETWIPYDLAEAADVVLVISDTRGAVVRRLDVGRRNAGRYVSRSRAAHWDGRNQMGERVASGVYVYELLAGDHRAVRRMVIGK